MPTLQIFIRGKSRFTGPITLDPLPRTTMNITYDLPARTRPVVKAELTMGAAA